MLISAKTDKAILELLHSCSNEPQPIAFFHKRLKKAYSQVHKRITRLHEMGILERIGKSPSFYKLRQTSHVTHRTFCTVSCPVCGVTRMVYDNASITRCPNKEHLTSGGNRYRFWINDRRKILIQGTV